MNEEQLWKLPPEVRDHYRRLSEMGIEISEDEAQAIIAEAAGVNTEDDLPDTGDGNSGGAGGEPDDAENPAEGQGQGDPDEADSEQEDGAEGEQGEGGEGGDDSDEDDSTEAQENLDIYIGSVGETGAKKCGDDGVMIVIADFSATVDRDGEVVTVSEDSDIPTFATLRLTQEQTEHLIETLIDTLEDE